jgi:hypothetical protein
MYSSRVHIPYFAKHYFDLLFLCVTDICLLLIKKSHNYFCIIYLMLHSENRTTTSTTTMTAAAATATATATSYLNMTHPIVLVM